MKVYAIDIDGTALDFPQEVRKLYDDKNNIIILHSARNPAIRFETERLLQEKNIPYHALVLGKLRADIYIDDKNQGGLQWPKI